jgi:serine/threonine protein kinase
MRSDLPGYTLTLVDPLFFESLSRYSPRDEYSAPVREMLGRGWTITPAGFWTHCTPPDATFRQQGWKIHIAAVPATAHDVLSRVVPMLAADGIPFKFTADRRMHVLSLSKNWPREGAGKFMTIYPASDAQFVELAAELHDQTRDLRGPYILSDRPYHDSRTVFYRYGEHLGAPELTADGRLRRVLHSPEGVSVDDTRTPYYKVPGWINDPFGRRPVENVRESGREIRLAGRYRVTEALKFNSSGGIYAAIDERTDRPVVVREARPHFGAWSSGQDAISLLQKEARILEAMGPSGLCPGFVDLFQQWEHWFLVQDRIDAMTLWGHAIGFYWGRLRRRSPRETFRRLRDTFLAILDGMQAFHDRGIVLCDMTRTNVLVRPDGRPAFIDFEMAYELDRGDPPVHGFTLGFASADQLAGKTPSPADDHYALGALLLDMVSFTVGGLPLHREGILAAFRQERRDLELPAAVEEVVEGLLLEDAALRWKPQRVRETLLAVRPRDVPRHRAYPSPSDVAPHSLVPRPAPTPGLREEIAGTIPEVVRFIEASADLERTDRLWPASPDVFFTNPVSVQFGAAGILAFLHEATGRADPRYVDWMVARLREGRIPPGMQRGKGGAALVLARLGREEEALGVVRGLSSDPVLENASGLWAGRAGVGLTLLTLGRQLGRPELVEEARQCADRLLAVAKRSRSRLFWHDSSRRVPLGLGHGAAGVALFLLYTAAATGEERYLEAARSGLEFDLAHVVRKSGEPLWTPTTHAIPGEPNSPHTEYGSAGIGGVALRMYALTRDPKYLDWAWDCARSVCERLTNKTWYNQGLAGFGHYLLDMHRFLGDENCLNTAFYLAEALLPHRIATGKGTAFAGSELSRISCDFGMGSAGIAWFLLRLLEPARPHPFFLNDLLAARPVESSLREAARRRTRKRELAATG